MFDNTIKVLSNKDTYVSEDIINQCFEIDTRHSVNKGVCGNGFSFGFLSLPIEINKADILICPNRSVVLDKEQEYKRGLFPNQRIGFIYNGSKLKQGERYTKVVCVADSFNNHFKELKKRFNIRKILVDEYHTVIQSSDFRKKQMRNLKLNLDSLKGCAITDVTATPLLSQKSTIEIKNEVEPRTLCLSHNIQETINRVVSDIHEGYNVLIFSQSASLITKILRQANRFDICYKGGEKLLAGLCKKNKYTFNDLSNITICSSASYEGWSSHANNGKAYMFASYNEKVHAMLGANVIQSMGRLRNGSLHSELCLFKTSNNINFHPNTKEAILKMIDSPYKTNKKQSNTYEWYYNSEKFIKKNVNDFLYFFDDDNGELQVELINDAVEVNKEIAKVHSLGFDKVYKDMFNERRITLFDLDNDVNSNLKQIRVNRKIKIENLIHNLAQFDIEDDIWQIALYPYDDIEKVGELSSILNVAIAVKEFFGLENENDIKALELIESDSFESDIKDIYVKRKLEKKKLEKKRYSKKNALKDFENDKIVKVCYNLVYEMISGNKSHTFVGARDYNNFTKVSNKIISYLSSGVGLNFYELDISKAYSRVVFRTFNKDIPNDFYGVDKSKKKEINIILNKLHTMSFYQYKKDKTTKGTKKGYEKYLSETNSKYKKKLLKYFESDMVEWLLDNFGKENHDSGKFFEYMARHERSIIKKCSDNVKCMNNHIPFNSFRKHDALLIFSTSQDLDLELALKTEHLKHYQWFNLTEYFERDYVGGFNVLSA